MNKLARVSSLRLAWLCLFALAGALPAADAPPAYPLWDNAEPIAEYAKKVNLPPTQTLDLGNGVKLELVLIPAGKFVMGTPEHEEPVVGQVMLGVSASILIIALFVVLNRASNRYQRPQFSLRAMLVMTFIASIGVWGAVRWNEALKHLDRFANEHPAHQVTLTKPFYMGTFAVTQEQYQTVMGHNPSQVLYKDNPVETVTWNDTQDFCKVLSEQTKQTVRLPTEAEWEYACRAGTMTAYYSGYTEADLASVAWYSVNSKGTIHPVGRKEPNKFGLYDMHGNVWQRCQDFYSVDYYEMSEAENPTGPAQGGLRVLRGGAWHSSPLECRSAYRSRDYPSGPSFNVGFRVCVKPAFRTP